MPPLPLYIYFFLLSSQDSQEYSYNDFLSNAYSNECVIESSEHLEHSYLETFPGPSSTITHPPNHDDDTSGAGPL